MGGAGMGGAGMGGAGGAMGGMDFASMMGGMGGGGAGGMPDMSQLMKQMGGAGAGEEDEDVSSMPLRSLQYHMLTKYRTRCPNSRVVSLWRKLLKLPRADQRSKRSNRSHIPLIPGSRRNAGLVCFSVENAK
jgi:hypothetical protein